MNEIVAIKAVTSGAGAALILGTATTTEFWTLLASGLVASSLSVLYDFFHEDGSELDRKLLAKTIKVTFYAVVAIFVSFYILSTVVHDKINLPNIVWILVSALIASNAVSIIDWGVDLSRRNIEEFVAMLRRKWGK